MNLLQDAMQRRVLRSLGQCVGGQGVSVDRMHGKGWRKAADALVQQGLAEVANTIALEQTYRVTPKGRAMLRAEVAGAAVKPTAGERQ